MRKLFNGQDGLAMIMVIGFMGIAVPMLTGALVLSGSLSADSQVKTRILKNQYSALGADVYAQYVIEADMPPGNYPISLNGGQIDVALLDLPTPVPPPPPADNSRKLQTSKTVTPTTAPASTSTTYTYIITVTNSDDDLENLNKIHDELPEGFTYVSSSTAGVTTNDPAINGQKLTWDVGNLGLVLQPKETATLTFDAQASVLEGNYCNQAWAEPGKKKTSSGLTAKIKVGSPADDSCPGRVAKMTVSVEGPSGIFVGNPNPSMTFTYTIDIENTGTLDLRLHDARHLLPPGFLYVPGTISGDIAGGSFSNTMFQGRERLTWDYGPADRVIVPGEIMTLVFDAEGVFTGGHWSDVWLNIHDIPDTVYSWPTAGIQVLDIVETTSTTPSGTTVYTQVWQIGPDSYILYEWEISS